MTDHFAGGIDERHTAVALPSPVNEPSVAREKQLQMPRMVGCVAIEHRLARRPTQGDFKVGKEGPSAPDGERPEARPIFTHLGHERVLGPECVSQVPHERTRKSVTRFCFDAFNDHA